MLHPLMPFITEELWNAMSERPYELIVAKWPEPQAQVDPHAKARTRLARSSSSSEVRSARTELNVPPRAEAAPVRGRRFGRDCGTPRSQASRCCRGSPRLESIQLSTFDAAPAAAQIVVDEATFALPLEGVIDLEAEKARLSKAPQPPRRNATASPSASPTRTSPSAPSPKRSRRRAPTMTRNPPRPNASARRWSG